MAHRNSREGDAYPKQNCAKPRVHATSTSTGMEMHPPNSIALNVMRFNSSHSPTVCYVMMYKRQGGVKATSRMIGHWDNNSACALLPLPRRKRFQRAWGGTPPSFSCSANLVLRQKTHQHTYYHHQQRRRQTLKIHLDTALYIGYHTASINL